MAGYFDLRQDYFEELVSHEVESTGWGGSKGGKGNTSIEPFHSFGSVCLLDEFEDESRLKHFGHPIDLDLGLDALNRVYQELGEDSGAGTRHPCQQ